MQQDTAPHIKCAKDTLEYINKVLQDRPHTARQIQKILMTLEITNGSVSVSFSDQRIDYRTDALSILSQDSSLRYDEESGNYI